LIAYFNYDIKLVLCKTVRESDGLAMSSRNRLLNQNERKLAPIIFATLSMAKKLLKEKSIVDVKEWSATLLRQENLINFEYFEIVDADTLKPINYLHDARSILICTAMKIGNVRLIDNILVKN
jgi:pantoate--beta-alanine ligase